MNQEKIAQIIKKIRKDNNLTQKDLADTLGVTYQAVSKWENGKNIPDISILKIIKEKYNINIDDLLDGNYKENKKDNSLYYKLILGILLIVIVIVLTLLFLKKDDDIHLKDISSSCSNFTISGSIAYTDAKTSINILKVEYCGVENNEEYKLIECALYEETNDKKTKITSCESKENITLKDYLDNTKINVDNYKKNCKRYVDDSLYIEIEATSKDNNSIIYKVPLKLEDNCH